MNSGKSMDDILDSIRKIVHEEETGDPAPPPRSVSLSEALKRDADTLVLTDDMRVDGDSTLNLSRAEQVSDDEIEAIASLRLDSGAAAKAEETEREAVASLRLDPASDDHPDEVAAFGVALAEDDYEADLDDDLDRLREEDRANDFEIGAEDMADESLLDAAEEASDDEPEGEGRAQDASDAAEEKDPYGFAIPSHESSFSRKPESEAAPREPNAFSLRLNRTASEVEEDAEDSGGPEDVIFGGGTPIDAVDEPVARDDESDMDADDVSASRAQIERIVRSAVREELSGALGDKITRNIRGMVRSEIKRVMETKQIK